jgi:hypothetical protein
MVQYSDKEKDKSEKEGSETESEPSIHRYQSQMSESRRKLSDASGSFATLDVEDKTEGES